MCGFSGVVYFERCIEPREQRLERLRRMGAQLEHRGPDDEQVFVDDHFELIFRRLSIVDLEGGQQPIFSEDRNLVSAINGEIYNHSELRPALASRHELHSRSDAEVVVHLYEDRGPNALEALNGMFAIVIWDRRQRRLFLARDRLGIKPLYYADLGSKLLFASELKALLVHPDCPTEIRWNDTDLLFGKGSYRNEPPMRTFIQGVEQLAGGHWLCAAPGAEVTVERYWDLASYFPEAGETTPRPTEEIVRDYAQLLQDSVAKRLMSDVPLGLHLSGGLDSSLIATLAHRARGQDGLDAFHILEPSVIATGDSAAAARLSSELRMAFHPVFFTDDLLERIGFDLDTLEYFIWLLDVPHFNLELLFKHELHRYSKTIMPDLKVVLLGQGADEFAGGYSAQAGAGADSWGSYLRRQFGRWNDWPPEASAALGDAFLATDRAAGFHREMDLSVRRLQEYNLWHEDRTSMAHGIEARVPFLDHRLVELCATIGRGAHAELFWDKAITRAAGTELLPDGLATRAKVGLVDHSNKLTWLRMTRQVLMRTFPDFRERYLDSGDSLFAPSALIKLHRAAMEEERPEPRHRQIRYLEACMHLTIFHRVIKDVRAGQRPRPLVAPSPLFEIHDRSQAPWVST